MICYGPWIRLTRQIPIFIERGLDCSKAPIYKNKVMLEEKVSHYLSDLGAARVEEARRSTREYAMLTLSAGDHAEEGIYPPPGFIQVGIVNNEDNSPRLSYSS